MTSRKHSLANWAATAVVLCGASLALAAGSNVAATRHNLTASGPGPIKTSTEIEVCAFCHTPHAANPIAPLWNRADPGTYYQTYESSTLKAATGPLGQPTGSSRLCLSCHDGTIALQQTYNANNAPAGNSAIYITPQDRGYIGTNLSDDHPISFDYDSSLANLNGHLKDPASLPRDLPLEHGKVLQCTTCHDPHDDSRGNFLRMDNASSRMCITCHDQPNWAASAHATSSASLASATRDQWTNLINVGTVAVAGCESCHRPHSAGGRQRLLRFAAEESNCLNCHDGTVASTNIAQDLLKSSTHAVEETTGVHDPVENPSTMNSHVECVDCHNPHETNHTGAALPPAIKPTMQGASGVTVTGQNIARAQYEYEVCFKCHGSRNFASPVVSRWLGAANSMIDEFSPTNLSYHPVEAAGQNTFVPSLLQPWQTTSKMYCTDCHGSDNGSGAKGPHGSSSKPLLVANYTTGDNVMEGAQTYALCYKCHNRTSIDSDQSFKKHHKHITDVKAACSVCHDAHGVQTQPFLINFDRTIVSEAADGSGPLFTTVSGQKTCLLTCHGVSHDGSAGFLYSGGGPLPAGTPAPAARPALRPTLQPVRRK